jgi:hypothetical protein
MQLSLKIVEDLAPDQSSLGAAKSLLKLSKWPMLGQAPSVNTIWGQCQGSGANPYSTMVDIVNFGYKCTCPSRKFPCKHVLALLWQFTENPGTFGVSDPPEWVNDWLGRRRKSSTDKSDQAAVTAQKNINSAGNDTEELSPEEIEKKEAAKEKRTAQLKENTDSSVREGLDEFQQWVKDQLRTGVGTFLKEITDRCRRIAARLVDAKAANFASRLDELPAKILSVDKEFQAGAVIKELGQLVLLSEAWLTDVDDHDARRAICTTENREQVLNNPDSLRKTGLWQKIGEKIFTRRDGLISHASWLLNLTDTEIPQFALLQDYYPASAGKKETGFITGQYIQGEIQFYPGRVPLRAFIVQYENFTPQTPVRWPEQHTDIRISFAEQLRLLPWIEYCPGLLNSGRVVTDNKKYYWKQISGNNSCIPLINSFVNPLLLACDIDSSFILFDGEKAELLSAQTVKWGTLQCQN